MSESTIRKTLFVVDGIELHKFHHGDLCETGQLTNFKRLSSPQRGKAAEVLSKLLDLVYCDLQRKFSGKCLRKANCDLPLLNDASGLSMVRALKSMIYSVEAGK